MVSRLSSLKHVTISPARVFVRMYMLLSSAGCDKDAFIYLFFLLRPHNKRKKHIYIVIVVSQLKSKVNAYENKSFIV